GVTAYHRDLGPKRLGLLHELLPAPGLVALLANSRRDEVTTEYIREIEGRGPALGKTIDLLDVANDAELAVALTKLGEQRPQALLVESDSLYFSRADEIVAAVSRLAIPTLYFRREFVSGGGLISYGSDTEGTYRVLGEYAGRILKGQ